MDSRQQRANHRHHILLRSKRSLGCISSTTQADGTVQCQNELGVVSAINNSTLDKMIKITERGQVSRLLSRLEIEVAGEEIKFNILNGFPRGMTRE